jgi:hypothetical protein
MRSRKRVCGTREKEEKGMDRRRVDQGQRMTNQIPQAKIADKNNALLLPSNFYTSHLNTTTL